jgi:hypothetical protein
MKKILAFIAAAELLISAGCGKTADPANEAEENTTVTETETSAEEDTTAATDSADKLGTQFFMLPDIRLGMTEDEVKALIDTDFERIEKKVNDIGPDVVYYNIPFDSFPYLGIDMEGYERLAFVPDGELISMACHFGVTDSDYTVKNKHSEKEIKAVYDKLFEQIHEHYGDYYTTNEKLENCIGDAGWSNSFGNLSLTAVYLSDKETGDVYMQDMSDEGFGKLLAYAKEKAQETTTDISDNALPDGELISEGSLFSQLDSRFTIDQALSFIGKEPAYSEERISCPFYEWNFDKDDAFGTELPFTLYVEFDKSKDRISSYGYELGVHRIDGRYESLCDKDEIKKIFKALTPRFEAEYGTRSNEDIGSDSIYMWDDPNLTLLLLSDSESTDIIGSNFICIARSYE